VLHDCGALVRLLPEVDAGRHVPLVLDQCARLGASLPVRFAALCHDLGHDLVWLRRLAERWRVPTACRELAEVVAREHGNIHRSADLGPEATLRLLERCDAIRKPQRFAEVLLACECDARGRTGFQDSAYPQGPRLQQALDRVLAVATAPVAAAAAAQGASGVQIGDAVRRARVAALLVTP
jgi:tRNA nucleotidyltransferase (CCA-adding enzyme)